MTEKNIANIEHYDYKDTVRIFSHLNPHARMHGRRRTGHKAYEQRGFATAVKRARFMALIPYVSR